MFAYILLGLIALYIAVRFLLMHRRGKRTPSTEDIDRELLASLNPERDSHV